MSNALHYLLLAGLAVTLLLYLRRRRERNGEAAKAEVLATGLNVPASLQPIVDPLRCVGSGVCAQVCPVGALGGGAGHRRIVTTSSS